MEGGKQSGSSFTSDLFGAKRDASGTTTTPSSGYFGSIFEPPARVTGVKSLNLSETDKNKKNDGESQGWSGKATISDNNAQRGQWSTTQNDMSSYYQEGKVEPFHYSSSIYYGGQDVYSQPQSAQNPTFSKDVGEDDSGSASRGNWWKGSLYY